MRIVRIARTNSLLSIFISLALIFYLRLGHLSYTLFQTSSADSRTYDFEIAPVLREGRDEKKKLGADAPDDTWRSRDPSGGSTAAQPYREDGAGGGDGELSSGKRAAPAISPEGKIVKFEKSKAGGLKWAKEKLARLSALHSNIPESQAESPACHPHFGALTSGSSWTWSNTTKFRRLYFYHARKAGGTSLAYYFSKVAHHHGLKFDAAEHTEAEEPGTHEMPTFYVAHLREPVDRAISHFKYHGRWHCRNLTGHNGFIPTEENANKFESWNETGGHSPTNCDWTGRLWLPNCAVNCYTQWFSGLSCPEWKVTTAEQRRAARETLLRYNFVVVLERLADPAYARAVEEFFGVPGVTDRRGAFCELQSRRANKSVPLRLRNETRRRLVRSNGADIGLYGEIAGCLGHGRDYGFPKLDENRFEAIFPTVPHFRYDSWITEQKKRRREQKKRKQEEKKRKQEEKKRKQEEKKNGGDKQQSGGEKKQSGGEKKKSGGEKKQSGGKEEAKWRQEKKRSDGEKKQIRGEKKQSGGEQKQIGGEKKQGGRENKQNGRDNKQKDSEKK